MGSPIKFLTDRLTSIMSGMGTTIDRAVGRGYVFSLATPQQAEAAYRTSWLMRKIVDTPALDMTRAWRQWQADGSDIEKVEAEEKRLMVKAKVKRALILARLYGGSAIFIGTGDTDPEKELKPESIRAGGLKYLHVFHRWQITTGQLVGDPDSPWFGQPEMYQITPTNGKQISIHPSRVIPFVGQPIPEGSMVQADLFWGDPLYQALQTALQNADLAQDGFAALIDEAKVDIVKIPGLMEKWSTDEYADRFLARLQAAQMGKSTWRMMAIDGEEEWEQRQIDWGGMPDMIMAYLQIVAGAADMPITRLLGQSPKGLQSTGDGEERDYHAMIEARQEELMGPAMDRLDPMLIASALGSVPSDIWYRWNPLMRLSPKDQAEVEFKRSQTVKQYADSGLIGDKALAEMTKNAIVESGAWPGSEAAFEDDTGPDAGNGGQEGEEGGGVDPNELLLPEQRAANDTRRPRRIMDRSLDDARPRSLYVSRRLINADDLIRWAKANGFETTQPADALHVTVAFSRKPVDWMKVGDDWASDEDGKIRVKPGGPRTVERLGEKGAVVLMFRNDGLEYRHRRIHEEDIGAQWDFPEYQPHVTITWSAPADLDIDSIEPYQGPLVFGPEIFAEVQDDWEKTIKEE